jgi:hypothetical protein
MKSASSNMITFKGLNEAVEAKPCTFSRMVSIPLSSLAGFDRVSVGSGGDMVQVKIELLASKALTLVDETGASVLYPGLHFIDVWDGSPSNNITIPIEVPGGSEGRVVKRPPLMKM